MKHYQLVKNALKQHKSRIAAILSKLSLTVLALPLFAYVGMNKAAGKADSMEEMNAAKAGTTKVIGYFVPDRSEQFMDQIAWNRLSHVILMGIDPDSEGNWQLQEGRRKSEALIPRLKAKNPKIRILGSIWGSSEIVKWIDEEGERKRAKVIANLVSYLSDNGYDGADVDIEGSKITANWENFILETKAALKEKNMLFAGALAGWNQPNTTQKGKEAFDWVNIMAYDEKGSWRPGDPGQHSSIEGMTNAF